MPLLAGIGEETTLVVPTLHIRLLGDFQVHSDTTPVSGVDTPRLQSLLAYLVMHRGAPQSRSHLAFYFWPDLTEVRARANLRKQLFFLRHALPEADRFLSADAKTLQWRPEAPFRLDVAEFESVVAEAEQAEKTGNQALLRETLERAVTMYRGDLLPSCYDDWVLAERERLRQTFAGALERLVLLQEEQREYQAAIRHTQRLLRHDPLYEAAYRRLMRLQALSGNRASALRTYHECATVLQRELGVEPEMTTREAYERLLRVDSAPAAESPASAPPLVGRDEEWAQLQTAWRVASGGRPQWVMLTGEPGIGKTRLAEEMLAWASRQGVVTASTQCYASEGGLSYAAVAAWLRASPLQEVLPCLDEVWLGEVVRILPELLVERPDIPPPEPLNEGWQRQRLFEALARPFQEQRQLVLLLDDVQWCDGETLEWLPRLLRPQQKGGSQGERPTHLLVIGTMPHEGVVGRGRLGALLRDLRRARQLVQIELGPLDQLGVTSLATHVAGRELDADLPSELYRETEGNPLFVIEMVRAGLLAAERKAGDSELGTSSRRWPLPPLVHDALSARLQQLSPAAQELVGVAATIGREFTYEVLAKAHGADEETLVCALDELWQRRIVREQGAHAYDFSHHSLREVAYADLSAVRRRFLHRRVAQALEAVVLGSHLKTDLSGSASGQDLGAVSAQVAAHYELAGRPEQAIPHYRRAAEAAQRIYANEEAANYCGAAANSPLRSPGVDQPRGKGTRMPPSSLA